MKTNLQTYNNYKHSGVEWLGEIPEHWDVKKLKYSSSIYNGDSLNETKKTKFESDNLDDLAYISSKDIDLDTSNITYENGLRIPQNQLKYKVAPKESSLICIEGGSAGRKIAFSNQDVCFVNKLACVKAKSNVNSKFIYHTLKGSLFQTQFKLAMSGMIGGVAISSINNFYILNPPKEEQTAIANFLDDKTTKIDQAIAIKQKQIELLKERRQILIHKAVTRGLNESVKLKDSGVEWIGEIPEHWEVKRLKYVAEITYGISPHEKTYNDIAEGFILVNGPAEYSEAEFGFTRAIKWTTAPSKFAKKGSLLFCLRGSTTGRLNICHNDLAIGRGCAAIMALGNHDFLIKAIIALKDRILETFKGSTFPSVTSSDLDNYFVPYPPLYEQKEIAEFIEIATTKIANAISLKEQEIEKLKEYKMSLIDGVVTGKVRVF